MTEKLKPIFFETPKEFRKWLEKNHAKEQEVFIGYYKVKTGKPTMTWSESVDQAICFGWIDGVRKSIDDESYMNRFTPRKAGSNWSNINIQKVENLKKEGLMMPAGLAAYEKRTAAKSGVYSFENPTKELSPEYARLFKKNLTAWKFFNDAAPGYRKLAIHRIMSAKQEATRLKRLTETIRLCALGEKFA